MRVSVVNRINRRRAQCTRPDARTMRFVRHRYHRCGSFVTSIIDAVPSSPASYMRAMVLLSCGAMIHE